MRSSSIDREALVEIAQAVERERRRIARGLHDGVGRQLSEAARVLDRFDVDPRTERLRTFIEDALDATRSLTFDLGLDPANNQPDLILTGAPGDQFFQVVNLVFGS